MAEYIDREQVCENCNNKNYCEKEKCPVYKVSTADVVPRSELNRYKMCSSKEDYQNKVARLREREVAREIFEEIEGCFMFGERIYSIDKITYAELKKKYTENENG